MTVATHGSWLSRQAWIDAPLTDLLLIILPAFLVTGFILLFPGLFVQANQLPIWLWLALIVGVDVAHVYSTWFRTYLNPTEFQKHRTMLTWVPLACWVMSALLYNLDALLFWRVLAYIAVFHFIRQQYGFMAIYARKEPPPFQRWRWLDSTVIYLSMLYPLAYWHTHLPRNFNWFMEGDFIAGLPLGLDRAVGLLYVLAAIGYLIKEARCTGLTGQFNLPKNLLIVGTALSWNVGIVCFNGDLAFTATNVLSHGIPYMALIWLLNRRAGRDATHEAPASPIRWRDKTALSFILVLWLLAWLEEGLWDGLIWREHLAVFPGFSHLPPVLDHVTLSWLVPLLALPQSTHYIIDGFIWRLNNQDGNGNAF